jgi:hypothetical protein
LPARFIRPYRWRRAGALPLAVPRLFLVAVDPVQHDGDHDHQRVVLAWRYVDVRSCRGPGTSPPLAAEDADALPGQYEGWNRWPMWW